MAWQLGGRTWFLDFLEVAVEGMIREIEGVESKCNSVDSRSDEPRALAPKV